MFDIKYRLRKYRDKFYLFVAKKVLPKKLVLWCFIVVYGATGESPDLKYSTSYNYWVEKYNLVDM